MLMHQVAVLLLLEQDKTDHILLQHQEEAQLTQAVVNHMIILYRLTLADLLIQYYNHI